MASVERIGPTPEGATGTPVAVSTIVARVRRRLGLMLVLLGSAAAVAGVALAMLIARQEATPAIAAAAVVLAVTLVIAAAMFAERRSLRRDAARGRSRPARPVATPTVAATEGPADWIGEPATGEPNDVRDQADLLQDLLHWPERRGA